MNFELVSNFRPAGDQPQAIHSLVSRVKQGVSYQTLLGVTGSGKTFTMANVIAQIGHPALILSHNKTLAAQLFKDFKEFFPHNAVEYFVSYYDFYQPEAYLPISNTYIEKDFGINAEIERMRIASVSALLSGRQDVVIVSSISCLYGMGNPEDYRENIVSIKRGMTMLQTIFLRKLVTGMYSRNQIDFTNGRFRVMGDTVDVFPAYSDMALRVIFYGDEIEKICTFNPVNGQVLEIFEQYDIYPAGLFTTTQDRVVVAVRQIEADLNQHICFLNGLGKIQEARRLHERVRFDIEMIRQLGYCSGIENYSRYFDGRQQGDRPFCLIDYFPGNFLMIIDESHVTIPQIRAMYEGDQSRKMNLVEYGFRLPAALDNRPLTFDEFESITPQKIFISATPAEYELRMCEGIIIEQVVRPTGLLDPIIEVRSTLHQIDDLMEEIRQRLEKNERTLVTTLTKRMAEELNSYFVNLNIQAAYIHSDIKALERVGIIDEFRRGVFDVLIGVNLLREGLDLPEVSLVAVLDADKEGFLRSYRSLTQIAGRAARNINGKVIFYADKMTKSMRNTIDDTNKRREKQLLYNKRNRIIPKQVQKSVSTSSLVLHTNTKLNIKFAFNIETVFKEASTMSHIQLEKAINQIRKMMLFASKQFEFLEAAHYRDELIKLENLMKSRFPNKK
ncbi:excinuclease ABC subunit UvrB [Candidatus Azobacteroides pseudotrichonymphae]|uniref:UvrABC system protein B n=1 Tax=Azobacteroides pseudotrichonymphae genomovar. CFP2 TaxID=511995 RepID=B6YQV7_AZOPC|nr:excinuclease ABC subunit UvrB [Candidatus Azobacteroides pseudotrichonymphae]BAG83579.1 excinuclease ABC subunit B [Candidatus Azobacteroides pseudotrichonymphae genomovar. CFP2]